MATTTDYINQLKIDKTNLVNNLVEKGIEATENETFTSLVPKVLDIQSGGSGEDSEIEACFISTLDNTYGANCTKLPDNLTSIGNYAFYYCKNLALTSLPDSITTIGMRAFQSCEYFNVTSLPSQLTTLGTYCFYSCKNLALTSLPSGITKIPSNCFCNCEKLALTSLPSGITSIDSNAFQNCKNIVLTSLPEGITAIKNNSFNGCTKLALTSLPSGITTIESSAFRSCYGIKELDIKSEVITKIVSLSFHSCSNLAKLILRATTPPTLETSVFTSTPIASGTGIIYVPDEAVETYKAATNWSTYADQIKGISEL